MDKKLKPRMVLIEEIKKQIVKSCPGPEADTRASIALWERGDEPRDMYDHGVFAVCDLIRKDMEKG